MAGIGIVKMAGFGALGLMIVGGGGAVITGQVPVSLRVLDKEPVVLPTGEPLETPEIIEQPEPKSPLDFDLVRIEPDGAAVIAGRGFPNTAISIMLDDDLLIEAQTDGQGQFAAITAIPPQRMGQRLWLRALGPDGDQTSSDATVVIASAALADPVDQLQGEIAAKTAPEILRVDESGVRAMGATPPQSDEIAIDSLSYRSGSELHLSGRAGAPGQLQVFVDNAPSLPPVALLEPGEWQVDLSDLAPGTYQLRLEVHQGENVIAETAMPLRREPPEVITALAPELGSSSAPEVITVQPGGTLWRIANDAYGDGAQYVVVYGANRDQIRDPNLIFPGQVLRLPETAAETAKRP
ncbi:MAG: LysM peptidoglycan-binding domain-containing protein [Mangrovicoccus sp.]